MKKFLMFSLVVIFMLLVSCSKSEKDDYATLFPGLLPDEANHYSLQAVGKEVTFEVLKEKGIANVNHITNSSSFKVLNDKYQLEIEQKPAFVLFDTNGLVLKTYDYNELIKFLQENQIE